MKQFKLECGAVITVRHVPTLMIEHETYKRYPEPSRPTHKHEIGPGFTAEREYEDGEYLRARRAYTRTFNTIYFPVVALELGVESVPDVGDVNVFDEHDYGQKVNTLLYKLLRTTAGTVKTTQSGKTIDSPNELDRLVSFIGANNFTFEEVKAQSRAMKSAGK